MVDELHTINITQTNLDQWVIRLRIPEGEGPHPVMLLLHGWTGDENSMWIFTSRLPKEMLLIVPRGLYTTPLGGFGWHPYQGGTWPRMDDFRDAVEAITELLVPENFLDFLVDETSFSRIRMLGFSQGAALASVYAMMHPNRVVSFAGLSGFLPDGSSSIITSRPLKNIPAFIAHGTKDELVPVERARRGVGVLRKAGAVVTYCEDDVGHKLSLSCFQGLESFFYRN